MTEPRERMDVTRPGVRVDAGCAWSSRLVDELALEPRRPDLVADAASLAGALRVLAAAPERVLLLDYDGTLTPLVATPAQAAPSPELRELLARLAALPGTEVHIVSGRDRGDLERWLGDLDLGLHAEHGFWSRVRGRAWRASDVPPTVRLERLFPRVFDLARRTPGALVERKASGLAFHYRGVARSQISSRLALLHELCEPHLGDELAWRVGDEVVELRLRNVDKGQVATRLLAGRAPAVLAAGDDATDEDLFAASPSQAITVRVGDTGPPVTRASHRVASPAAMLELLATLVQTVGGDATRPGLAALTRVVP